MKLTSGEPTDAVLPLRCKPLQYPMSVLSLDVTSSQWGRVNIGDPGTFIQTSCPKKSHLGMKMFIREHNKKIIGDQVGELTGHIPTNIE